MLTNAENESIRAYGTPFPRPLDAQSTRLGSWRLDPLIQIVDSRAAGLHRSFKCQGSMREEWKEWQLTLDAERSGITRAFGNGGPVRRAAPAMHPRHRCPGDIPNR